jgi:hypothetical protein
MPPVRNDQIVRRACFEDTYVNLVPQEPLSTPGRSGFFQHAGEAAVGNELLQGGENIHGVGEPRVQKRQRDGDGVEHRRNLALEITAERGCQFGFPAVLADDGGLQNVMRDGRQQQHAAV